VEKRKPIFYDERQRRWRRTRRALEITGAFFTLLVITFFVSIVLKPQLPEMLPRESRPTRHAIPSRRQGKPQVFRAGRKRRVAALGQAPSNYDPLRAAFYVSWDPTSLASLQQHYREIDVLIPEMLHAVSSDGRLDTVSDRKLFGWIQAAGVELPIMPLLNNYDGQTWRTKEMAAVLASPAARQRLEASLVSYVSGQHNPGLVLDFEDVPDASQPSFRRFVHELATALHAAGLKLMVTLPPDNPSYDYAGLARRADAIILMNYDEHWSTSPPGPIASQDWYLRNLYEVLRMIPPSKLIMGIANYAYDWPVRSRRNPHPAALSASFQEAVVTAVESEASIEFDPDSLNPHFSYSDEKNQTHEVWLLDGVTAYNELRAAERYAVRGTAVWRLGTEDPSLWSIWDAAHPDDSIRAKLTEVTPGYDLILEGDGDVWRITATPETGQRTFHYDALTDTFTDESFTRYPLSWRIGQLGAVPHKIALSFDDGPDPRWTPQILNVLAQKHAPATFFVIGDEANASLGLLRREYNEGHEIGNHTYTHPHFDEISRLQLRTELNVTERLLESSLGIKTLLFRPPYGIDHQPETAAEVALLPIPQQMGYLIVGARIDPDDWGEPGGGPPAPAETLVERVVAQATPGKGNIILLHDGGGDRSHTVAALPVIIDRLRQQGFEFVLVSDLVGETRAEVMPRLTRNEQLVARADAFIFDLYDWLRHGIAWIFVLGIVLVSGRALIIGLLALVERLRPAPAEHPEYRPPVSVLIPAFNEEAVIVNTVRAALHSDYPQLEVVVVDDGSTDRTAELVRENFEDDPRVKLVQQPNHGKAAALNRALAEARGDIVVTIDADTAVEPGAVPKLVRHFADPRVGAAAGNVKVANRDRWITRWQALEYITSQNLEKRAFDLLNCITVVPGAVGALRADLVHESGGFSGDTVAEDTDLTFAIRRKGWRIVYDEDAVGWTEAPETTELLIRQRFRWTFGTLQALWKHIDTLGRRRYGTFGWIALPNVFLFQFVFPLISPVIDLLFLTSLVLWGMVQFRMARMPQLWTAEDVERSLIFFIGFMLIDFLTCVIAFALEKKEDWSLLIPLLIQRFYYRQMMYVVLFRAITSAVKGRPVGWRGVEPQVPTPVAHV
jgi:cellulose synthase/poly-beta-1,6-N-acetylglucosamine synthase-like glycosyltransferase/spore germination protein YaaH/peptidoglycan/xylan/chitin deacetylase (PgdA/CDA1 family)